jgi:Cu/Ag efflux protein CusF
MPLVSSTTRQPLLGFLAAGLLCAAACSSEPAKTETPPASQTATPPAAQAQPSASQPTRYNLDVKVVAIDKSAKQLTVDGKDIPGFMSAMTMPYAVKDLHLLDNLKPGDQISASVVSTGSEFWLENIVVKPGAPAK